MKRLAYDLAVLFLVLAAAKQAQGQYIYWSDNANFGPGGDISRAKLDGSGKQTLISGLDSPNGIAVDAADGRTFWAQGEAGQYSLRNANGMIRSAKLDGTDQKTIASQQFFPSSVALDMVNQKVYWMVTAQHNEPYGIDIFRANLDGSGPQRVVHTIQGDGAGQLAIDSGSGKIYWTDLNAGQVRRANLDGSSVETLISQLACPVGIAVDPLAGHLYFSDCNTNQIRRTNLNGTGSTVVFTGKDPSDMTLDLDAGKMYWADYGFGQSDGDIRRANLDGSSPELLLQGLKQPFGIAVAIPEPSALSLLAIGGFGLIGRRRFNAARASNQC